MIINLILFKIIYINLFVSFLKISLKLSFFLFSLKAMLSNVLDLTFQSVLTTACLTRTRLRLQFLVRDLAPLLTPEEDSPWRRRTCHVFP